MGVSWDMGHHFCVYTWEYTHYKLYIVLTIGCNWFKTMPHSSKDSVFLTQHSSCVLVGSMKCRCQWCLAVLPTRTAFHHHCKEVNDIPIIVSTILVQLSG